MGSLELHVISPEGKVVKNPETLYAGGWIGTFDNFTDTWSPTGDWLSPNILLVAGTTPDAGRVGMDAINIDTGQLTHLWEEFFGDYTIDKKNKIVIIGPSEYTNPKNLGLYFITSGGQQTKVFDGMYYLNLFFRSGEKHRFLATGISVSNTETSYSMGGVVALELDGKPTPLQSFVPKQISISPDYTWLLMYDDEKLYLYDMNDELVKTFPIPGIENIVWRPDSQTIFYLADNGLYTLPIPEGDSKWVDSVTFRDTVWLP
jgi:hypothetical protein